MKKVIFLSLIIAMIIGSCTQKSKKAETEVKIENTLQTVHFWTDSIGIAPSELLASMERANKAIDSIGYPDAGHKLWIFQSGTNKDVRFMIEGYWPNQAIYDTIHKNELYINEFKAFRELLEKMKWVSYNRFTIIK